MISPQPLLAVIKLNLLRRPLWSVHTVRTVLDLSFNEAQAVLQDGRMPWVFSLSNQASRSEMRVWAACVVEYQAGTLPGIGATKNLNLPEVINCILPAQRPSVRCVELQRLFSCSPNLLHDLALRGEIVRVKENLPKTGPNASPRFTRDSLAAMLARNRVC